MSNDTVGRAAAQAAGHQGEWPSDFAGQLAAMRPAHPDDGLKRGYLEVMLGSGSPAACERVCQKVIEQIRREAGGLFVDLDKGTGASIWWFVAPLVGAAAIGLVIYIGQLLGET